MATEDDNSKKIGSHTGRAVATGDRSVDRLSHHPPLHTYTQRSRFPRVISLYTNARNNKILLLTSLNRLACFLQRMPSPRDVSMKSAYSFPAARMSMHIYHYTINTPGVGLFNHATSAIDQRGSMW